MNTKDKFKLGGGIVAVLVCGFLLIMLLLSGLGYLGQALSNPEVEAWLNQPASQLKVWHLLLILWFVGLITGTITKSGK